jgi:outer membrane protein assembly factor BamB
MYGGNPARTGAVSDTSIAGPLYPAWSRDFGAYANQPLIVGNRVLVNVTDQYGTRPRDGIFALNPRSGKTVWHHPTPEQQVIAPIAVEGGKVLQVQVQGLVRAYRVANGKLLWQRQLPGTHYGAPVVGHGSAYIWLRESAPNSGRLYSLSMGDGSILWSRNIAVEPSGTASEPALDGDRVYVTDTCGETAGIPISNGLFGWTEGTGSTDECQGTRAILSHGVLYAGDQKTYTPSGNRTQDVKRAPQAVADGRGLTNDGSNTVATPLKSGVTGWQWHYRHVRRANSVLPPIVVGPTVYTTTADRRLWGLDLKTGRRLSVARLPYPIERWDETGLQAGLAAGGGTLYAGEGYFVTAFRPVFHPRPNGVALGANHFYVDVGKEVFVLGMAGYKLRHSKHRLLFQKDPARFGRFGTFDHKKLLADGTAHTKVKVTRNTRFRARLGKGAASHPATIYAYPHYRVAIHAVSRRFAEVITRIRGVPGNILEGRKLSAYLGRVSQNRVVRLGTSRLHNTGPRTGVTRTEFKRLSHVGAHDIVIVCAHGISKAGWGRATRLDRRCGQKDFHLQLHRGHKAAKTGRALSAGAFRPPSIAATSAAR